MVLLRKTRPYLLFRLENASGAYVEIMDYGCRIMSICVPDKKGNLTDVALGLEDLDTYLKDDASLGAIVGRFANRLRTVVFP